MEMWESVVRMVSALGVVLALILGLLAVARSAVGRRFLPVHGTPLVRILGSGPLGARKQVMVVAVAGEVLSFPFLTCSISITIALFEVCLFVLESLFLHAFFP